MKHQEIQGALEETVDYHRSIGSSSIGFGSLIKNKEIKPDVPFGQQMTQDELQEYYNIQLTSLQEALQLPKERRSIIMKVVQKFQADLPLLETKGIDISAAADIFQTLLG